ncbi:Alpha/Beta hydrolase protein [Mycena rosella]|uniref:Alpha/Beta hydrolase protein n=1 Tax=Mycena rosella TaxID=1033263 RepID=A0AAD7CHH7_MYCRO|nr:Alpha/Beta hydrolase protein [Mycena rosella]
MLRPTSHYFIEKLRLWLVIVALFPANCHFKGQIAKFNLIDLKGRLVEPLRGVGHEVIGPHRRAIRSSHIFYLGDTKPAEWLAKPAKWLASHSARLGLGLPPKSKPSLKQAIPRRGSAPPIVQAQAIRPSQKSSRSTILKPHVHITGPLHRLAKQNSCRLWPREFALHIRSEAVVQFQRPQIWKARELYQVVPDRVTTGPRRWLPPVPKICPTAIVNATSFGLSCPQIPLNDTAPANVYTANGGRQTEFFPRQEFSEDCLTLNVWAPAQPQSAMLPVIVWFYGGGFTQGGADSLYFNAAPWVQRTQAHIVVSANFRTNIFGFPNAAGSAEQNPGLLDQRGARVVQQGSFRQTCMGIIMGPTGQPRRLFPETAVKDPPGPPAQANFAAVAAQLDCGGGRACRTDRLPARCGVAGIETVLAVKATLSFLHVPDERVVFANYTARYGAGLLGRVPALLGTNRHELNALGAQVPGFPNQTLIDTEADPAFLCTTAATAQLRQAHGRRTYLFRCDGNFTNISPPGFTGAYHASELPLILERQGSFTAVDDDPEKGLQTAGWNTFGAGKAVFLGDLDTPMKEVDVQELDGACAKK